MNRLHPDDIKAIIDGLWLNLQSDYDLRIARRTLNMNISPLNSADPDIKIGDKGVAMTNKTGVSRKRKPGPTRKQLTDEQFACICRTFDAIKKAKERLAMRRAQQAGHAEGF